MTKRTMSWTSKRHKILHAIANVGCSPITLIFSLSKGRCKKQANRPLQSFTSRTCGRKHIVEAHSMYAIFDWVEWLKYSDICGCCCIAVRVTPRTMAHRHIRAHVFLEIIYIYHVRFLGGSMSVLWLHLHVNGGCPSTCCDMCSGKMEFHVSQITTHDLDMAITSDTL